MIIELENIIPNALNQKRFLRSEIWSKNILFNPNDCIHIVSPSGTGKSTLMGILYFVIKCGLFPVPFSLVSLLPASCIPVLVFPQYKT